MIKSPGQTIVAYRCPSCSCSVKGFVGKFALSANLIRIKCPCGKSHLDVSITSDEKVRLSVPCFLCTKSHNYVVSQNIFFGRDRFLLGCPYGNLDIGFIGDEKTVDEDLARTEAELSDMAKRFELESAEDLQPKEVPDEEVLPDPEVYDMIRFLVKELEAEGQIDCSCHRGEYDLRFTDSGIQVYCPDCGATYDFPVDSSATAAGYMDIDSIKLS